MAQQAKKMQIVHKKAEKRVNVFWGGKLITAYRYDDSVSKPFLFPVNTVSGITVTRGWPLAPRAGERTDHPHQVGVWMNYESVNGLDFWNNSTAIPADRKHLYGTIRHDSVVLTAARSISAILHVYASWVDPAGRVLMREQTAYFFGIRDNMFFIERQTFLTAVGQDVVFDDVKDGFFAIRVARELEMPSQQADVFTDVHGNKTDVPKMVNNTGVTGNYISSEGLKGDSVWGTKARWMMLQGKKGGRDITIGVMDHPMNVGYPSYWHARGYGLFAINPFGRKVFTNGKEELNFTLKRDSSALFRYTMIVAEGKLTPKQMNAFAADYAKVGR